MRILQIGLSYGNYAQGAITQGIHTYLLKQGNESSVFYADPFSAGGEGAVLFEKGFERFLKRALRRVFGKYQLFARFGTFRLTKLVKSWGPDLIHIHNIHHLTTDYIYLFRFLLRLKKPVLFSMHDMWLLTGGCYHYTEAKCDKYLHGCNSCPQMESLIDCPPKMTSYHLKFKHWFYSQANPYFVTVSNWQLEECKKSKISGCPLKMISNGVDIKVFERKEPGYFDEIRKGTENIVLGVANFWTEEKGVHQFFELARLLGDGYKIMLVGKREKEFSDIPNNIHFIGSIGSKEQLAHAYSDADVFVHLAIEETFGLVIAEAACCGLYTIGYQSTGIAEVLKRAQGSLVRANDVNNVKTEVVRVCSAKLRLTGDDLETVRRDFSQENMIEKYIALYSEILSSDNEKVKK